MRGLNKNKRPNRRGRHASNMGLVAAGMQGMRKEEEIEGGEVGKAQEAAVGRCAVWCAGMLNVRW